MSNINDVSIVKQQYANANNLNTRISIHDKYSTNKMGFGNWIVSNYRIDKGMNVLELGWLNWNPSFQFASLSSDLANRLQK